jgi:hypothetical protein
MNFGLCKGNIVRAISEGMGKLDVSSADTIVRALLYKEVSAVCVGLSVLREGATKLIEGKQIKDAKLQTHSFRVFVYDENKKQVEAHLYEQSFMPDAKPSLTIKLDKIWNNSNADYDNVIPDVEVHPRLPFPLTRQYPIEREVISMKDMIINATTIHTSRIEMDIAMNDRKEAAEIKKKSAETSQYHLDNVRSEKIRVAAAERGCTVRIPCSTLGKIVNRF